MIFMSLPDDCLTDFLVFYVCFVFILAVVSLNGVRRCLFYKDVWIVEMDMKGTALRCEEPQTEAAEKDLVFTFQILFLTSKINCAVTGSDSLWKKEKKKKQYY